MGVVVTALRRPGTYAGAARELANAARCLARYPLGVLEAGGHARRTGDLVHDTPVVLVHGYGHNHSGWWVLRRHLRQAGFNTVLSLNYNPLIADVPDLAEQLRRRVDAVMRRTGSERVHVVGHSLGGVLLRWYVQELGGEAHVATAVTVASPHEGTLAALVPFGRTAQQLRPGSWVLRRLAHGTRPSAVKWIAFYSNLDILVQPGRSAMLRHPDLAATNLLVKDHGHLSILVSPVLARTIVTQLGAAERRGDRSPIVPLRPRPLHPDGDPGATGAGATEAGATR